MCHYVDIDLAHNFCLVECKIEVRIASVVKELGVSIRCASVNIRIDVLNESPAAGIPH